MVNIYFGLKKLVDILSSNLLFQGVVSPAWEQICRRAFTHAVPGPELDACLWSLTEALKRLLKGAFQGTEEAVNVQAYGPVSSRLD